MTLNIVETEYVILQAMSHALKTATVYIDRSYDTTVFSFPAEDDRRIEISIRSVERKYCLEVIYDDEVCNVELINPSYGQTKCKNHKS